MSRETASALTPEEWRARAIGNHGGKERAAFRDAPDGFPISNPVAFVREDGTLGVDNSGGEYGCPELDASKVMAIANLSLTIQGSTVAITQAHVNVCTSAAWYFRRLAQDAESARDNDKDLDSTPAYEHERALEAAHKVALELSRILSALVPPNG